MKFSSTITGFISIIVVFSLLFLGVGLYEITDRHIGSTIPATFSFCLNKGHDFTCSAKNGDVIVITTVGNSKDIELVQTISNNIRLDIVDEHTVEIQLNCDGDISGEIIVRDTVRNESRTINVCNDEHNCSWLCSLFF